MKYLRVTMPDQSVWQVPARLIGENHLAYYEKIGRPVEDVKEAAYMRTDEGDLRDWGRNNMNWEDVSDHATKVEVPVPEPDYQEGWVNGKWEFVEVSEGASAMPAERVGDEVIDLRD